MHGGPPTPGARFDVIERWFNELTAVPAPRRTHRRRRPHRRDPRLGCAL